MRRPNTRYERGLMHAAERARLGPIADHLRRRQTSLAHFEPTFGNLLFRWAVSVVSERYAAVERI